jgi:hypothetical protein
MINAYKKRRSREHKYRKICRVVLLKFDIESVNATLTVSLRPGKTLIFTHAGFNIHYKDVLLALAFVVSMNLREYCSSLV